MYVTTRIDSTGPASFLPQSFGLERMRHNPASYVRPHIHSVLLLLTNRCNLVCKDCYVESHPHGEYGLELPHVLRFLEDASRIFGPLTLNLSGGEPLTRPADCMAVITAARPVHHVKLLTNGLLISPKIARFVADLDVVVRVSLDGGRDDEYDDLRGPGTFLRLRRGLAQLEQAGYRMDRIEAYATILPDGVARVASILCFAEAIGIEYVKFESLAKGGRAAKFWQKKLSSDYDADILQYEEFFNYKCDSIYGEKWKLFDLTLFDIDFGTLTVYSDGNVYPFTYQDERDAAVGRLGNICTQSLDQILEPRQLEAAVVGKFALIARGPRRSLHAYAARRRKRGSANADSRF
jgi:MoaA/NifB/PqqE/SkfB family radical SAM enzyme